MTTTNAGSAWDQRDAASQGRDAQSHTNRPQLRLRQSDVALALSHISTETPAPGALWRQSLLSDETVSPPAAASLPQPFQRGPLHHSLTPAQGSSPALPSPRGTILEKGGVPSMAPPTLATATGINNHVRDVSLDNVAIAIEVEDREWPASCWHAAGVP